MKMQAKNLNRPALSRAVGRLSTGAAAALAAVLVSAAPGAYAVERTPAEPPFRVEGLSDEQSCAQFVDIVGGFMDDAPGVSLAHSLAFQLFAEQERREGRGALAAQIERHGTAANTSFSNRQLARGYVMSACMYSIPSLHSGQFASYFSRKCSSASSDAMGRACFVPAFIEVRDCLKKSGFNLAGRAQCLQRESVSRDFEARLFSRVKEPVQSCFEKAELGQAAAARSEAQAILSRKTVDPMTKYQALYCLASGYRSDIESMEPVKAGQAMAEMLKVQGNAPDDRRFMADNRVAVAFMAAAAFWGGGDDKSKVDFANIVINEAPGTKEAEIAKSFLTTPSRITVRVGGN